MARKRLRPSRVSESGFSRVSRVDGVALDQAFVLGAADQFACGVRAEVECVSDFASDQAALPARDQETEVVLAAW